MKDKIRNRDARSKPPSLSNTRSIPEKRHRKESDAVTAIRRSNPELAEIYGFHAVKEALNAGRRDCLNLFATDAAAEKLSSEIAQSGVRLHKTTPEALRQRLGADAVHQGLFLEARPIEPLDITEIQNRSGIVLALDQVTDPHNVGAILRTAAAFAVDALITTERHAPEFSGVLAKTASGGLEHVPQAPVVNLARALDQLADMGYWRIGFDSEGETTLGTASFSAPVVLVLGAEGKGLRRLTREKCDQLVRLDMPGPIKSLNVSNACAIALALVHETLAKSDKN